MTTKADDAVATLIAEELSKKGFAPLEGVTAFAAQLAGGNVSAEDWTRLVEQKEDKEAKDSRAH